MFRYDDCHPCWSQVELHSSEYFFFGLYDVWDQSLLIDIMIRWRELSYSDENDLRDREIES